MTWEGDKKSVDFITANVTPCHITRLSLLVAKKLGVESDVPQLLVSLVTSGNSCWRELVGFVMD